LYFRNYGCQNIIINDPITLTIIVDQFDHNPNIPVSNS